MLDLETAEVIERPIPQGMYSGPVPTEVKRTAEEFLRSLQGTGRRQRPETFQWTEPTLRVSRRGTVQMLWERPWGGASVAVRASDHGGSIGLERYPKGDTEPDPELSTSYPLIHVVSEMVAFLSRDC